MSHRLLFRKRPKGESRWVANSYRKRPPVNHSIPTKAVTVIFFLHTYIRSIADIKVTHQPAMGLVKCGPGHRQEAGGKEGQKKYSHVASTRPIRRRLAVSTSPRTFRPLRFLKSSLQTRQKQEPRRPGFYRLTLTIGRPGPISAPTIQLTRYLSCGGI